MRLQGDSSIRRLGAGMWVVAIVVAAAGVADASAGGGSTAARVVAQTGHVPVEESTLAAVEQYLETARSEIGLPGLAAGIVVGDEVAFVGGFGAAASGVPSVGPDTPFLVASLSKSMTALAVMQLVEDGRVDLDEPVTTYLPELSPGGDGVSVRDLMHHRSGLATLVGVEPFWEDELGASLHANVARLGPSFHTDASHEYSNANYDTLALIVERVSGIAFAGYMQQHVFEPLGMANTQLDSATAEQSGLAAGHYHWLLLGYREHTPTMPVGMPGSHTVFSSAEDLTHLMIAHLNGGMYRGTRVASDESMETLHEPRPYGPDTDLGYAGGLRVEPSGTPGAPEAFADYTNIWHDGSSESYRSVMWMIPEAGLGFVVLANGNDLTDESFLPQVARNVKFILAGEQPFEIVGVSDFLTRWGKHLLLLVVLGQLALAFATVQPLRRLRRGGTPEKSGWVWLSSATLLDFIALALLVFVIPSVGEVPLQAAMTAPDYRILIIGMIIGVIWGLIRTGLVTKWLYTRRSKSPVEPTSEPAIQ